MHRGVTHLPFRVNSQASSSTEAELYAMEMAVQDSLHLKSLLQEMQLSQLAKPFELTVYTDSSSGKALASKLGLSKRSRHVQLRCLFRKGLLANGQLQLSKIPTGKNPAVMLTRHLSASNLHKLLPKLGVTTRAADSEALRSVLNLEALASSSKEPSSFFIGMMAEQPASAQLVASSVASRACLDSSLQKHCQDSSFQEHRQEAASKDCPDSSLQEQNQRSSTELEGFTANILKGQLCSFDACDHLCHR